MLRRAFAEYSSTTKLPPRVLDISSEQHPYLAGVDDWGNKRKELLEHPAGVGVTYTQRQFDVVNTTLFRMEGFTSKKETIECDDAPARQLFYEGLLSSKSVYSSAPVHNTVSANPISVLLCLVFMMGDAIAVSLGDAAPVNYPRSPAKPLHAGQKMVHMPPFDLGFRGQTSDPRTNNHNYYNPYWRQENAYFYANRQSVKPGTLMSLNSGYSKNYRAPDPTAFRQPYQGRQLPLQQRKSHELMQNDPVYTPDEGAPPMGMSKPPHLYGQLPVGYGNSKPTFDQYNNRWQPQDSVYSQTGGYSDNLYNRPEQQQQQMPSWERVEPPVYNPNVPWNHGYQVQSYWYDPAQAPPTWQQLPYYELPYQQQRPQEEEEAPSSSSLQGYGPVYGDPSNYGEVSEAELAARLAEYEQNAREAGILQETGGKPQLAEELQLPQLNAPEAGLPGQTRPRQRQKDKGITISGSAAHDDMMRNFHRVASGYNGPYGVEAFFNEIDLNNDRVIDIEELTKFLQLHELVGHH